MTFELYTRILDGLSYAVHSTAHRRDTRNAPELIDVRDAFAREFPEFQARYVPAGER
ncbi:hypothetical protein ACWGKS_29525 [Nocardiopsis sp. NPDC055879]